MKLKLNKCRSTGEPILTIEPDEGRFGYRVAGAGHSVYREIREVGESEIPARHRIQHQVARAIREHPALRVEAEAFLDRLFSVICLKETWRNFKGAR